MSEKYDLLRMRVFAAVDNLAAHAAAAEWLAVLGQSVIAPLKTYLEQPPVAIPQARCFAVAMLARLEGVNATVALRGVLYNHPLAGLGPLEAQAEYVVKNEVITALTRRDYADLAADIGFALAHERLPAAAVAAGKLHLTSLSSTLATMLDDDVLAAAAAGALPMLGRAGADALLAALQVRLETPQADVRNRFALIRVLLALGRMERAPPFTWLVLALRQDHPAVRAAAAWVLWRTQPRLGLRRALLHGALTAMPELSRVCREALDITAWPGCAALVCLRRGWEKDVYGDRIPISPDACAWVIERTLASAQDVSITVKLLAEQSESLLQHTLERGHIRYFDTARCLYRFGDPRLGAAAISSLSYCGDAQALELAISACTDPDRRVRASARRAIKRWPHPYTALRRLIHCVPHQMGLLAPIPWLVLRMLRR